MSVSFFCNNFGYIKNKIVLDCFLLPRSVKNKSLTQRKKLTIHMSQIYQTLNSSRLKTACTQIHDSQNTTFTISITSIHTSQVYPILLMSAFQSHLRHFQVIVKSFKPVKMYIYETAYLKAHNIPIFCEVFRAQPDVTFKANNITVHSGIVPQKLARSTGKCG